MDNSELIAFFSDEINNLLRTGKNADFTNELYDSVNQLEAGETKNLFLAITELLTKIKESQDFITDLSNGKLDTEPPHQNLFISPFKQLHANLSHLIWQVQRLSEGDLNQRIDFLGDFSLYFNKLIQSLREKKQIEDELRNSEEGYRISVDNANIGIITVGLTGKILTANKECRNIFGYSPSELKRMTINGIAVPEDEMISENYIRYALKNPKYTKTEFVKRYVHKSGKVVTCQVSSSLIRNADNEPLFFISHIKDITLQIESEQELRDLNARLSGAVKQLKQANAVKDKFFGIIAHDLRKPFNAILGFSELLAENLHKYNIEEIRKFVIIISQASQNTFKLLENLLEWSMSQTGRIAFNPTDVIVEDILKDVIGLTDSHAKIKNISVSYIVSDGLKVYADANMLNTTLRNLASNAIKFTRNNGKVAIRVERVEHNTNETLFTVSDTGIGMSPKTLDSLFKIEEKVINPGTDEEMGTGLGLLLCKEFVERHGGRIWAESVEDKGSDFKFTLPAPTTA